LIKQKMLAAVASNHDPLAPVASVGAKLTLGASQLDVLRARLAGQGEAAVNRRGGRCGRPASPAGEDDERRADHRA
jgi:hypothetical protein